MEPDWKAFSKKVHYSAEIYITLNCLNIKIPPNGRPVRYVANSFTVEAHTEGTDVNFILWQGSCGKILAGESKLCISGGEVLENLKPIPPYGETGASLREWLIMWGWQPPTKKTASESTQPMVI